MKLLSIEETCQMLGISRRTIYRLIDKGELKPVKIGWRTKFIESEILEMIERNRGIIKKKQSGRKKGVKRE